MSGSVRLCVNALTERCREREGKGERKGGLESGKPGKKPAFVSRG